MPFPSKEHQFRRGEPSANPAGRPKGPSIASAFRDLLDSNEIAGKTLPRGMTVREAIAQQMALEAMNGDVRAAAIVFERAEGKVPAIVQADVKTGVKATDDELERMLAAFGYVRKRD